ncbi:MAG: class I SAM-dependent methyltransferase [Deltaproteobacteria bacterium]|nr:MAG: class I SAM-dependent methyltransferase [Deltaproteobacteria bacterium]
MDVGTSNESSRIAWVKRILSEIPPGLRILDAGAGELKYKPWCAHLEYVSQDSCHYSGEGDGRGLQPRTWDTSRVDIVSDITSIPEPDGSFDAVMCIEVLEHLPNASLVLEEFNRLLRQRGHLIVTAPFCSLTHFAPYHFYSGFNTYFYEKHLPEYGFRIVEIERNGNFFEYLAQEIRRLPAIMEKYAECRPRIWETVAMRTILLMLQRLTTIDKRSGEILCFGYHVYARKE